MTLRVFVHLRLKRAETVALLDSGATENFINISYAQKLNLPIRRLTQERRLFNVDGTPNKAGTLKYYTDIVTRTGTKCTRLCYFLTDLGDNQVILGYPWFASAQLRIDWAKGWIDYSNYPLCYERTMQKKQYSPPESREERRLSDKPKSTNEFLTHTECSLTCLAIKNQRNSHPSDHGTTKLN